MEAERLLVPDVTAAALPLFERAVTHAVAERGRAVVALCGGSTPLPLFRALAATDLPWDRLWVTFGDERFVALDHPDSNAGAASAAFLDLVPIPEQHILTWPILEQPQASAEAYRGLLENALDGFPTFDINLLGLGSDGHTASLFPGTGDVLLPGPTLALQAPAGVTPGGWRLSLSASALSNSRLVLFLVAGAGKTEALQRTFGASDDEPLSDAELDAQPARAITARERLLLVTDVPF